MSLNVDSVSKKFRRFPALQESADFRIVVHNHDCWFPHEISISPADSLDTG